MSQSSHASGRAPHETRRLILRAAQHAFMEQGYRAVSTRQIAAECGITQPALYRHFATKQELYIAVLLDMLQESHRRLTLLVKSQESIVHRLHLVARMLPTTWQDTTQMFHDIEHELDTKQRQIVADAFQHQVVEPIASLFVEGVTQGLLRDAEHGGLDGTEATFVLFRLLDDHATAGSRPHSRVEHADRMVDILLQGLMQSNLHS